MSGLAAAGIPSLPDTVQAPALDLWYPEIVLVVEGAARAMAAAHATGSSQSAAGSGPGEPSGEPGRRGPGEAGLSGRVRVVAELAGDTGGLRLAVTADRELRQRCLAAGAAVTGPSWLLSQL
jgi:hypothetical protein